MSFRTVQQNTIPARTFSTIVPSTWKRNPSWPALVTPTGSAEELTGLYKIYPGGANFAAFNVTVTSGNYRVEWGDGTQVDTASGVQVNKEYNYADAALNGTNAPVTFTDSGDLVSRTAHGYLDNDNVQFFNIVSTTGLVTGQTYFVINATANDFQVSLTLGGSPVALTTNGSGTLLDYKIAIVRIYPVTGGATFTALNLSPPYSPALGVTLWNCGWLDIRFNTGSTTGLSFQVTSTGASANSLETIEVRYATNGTAPFASSSARSLVNAVFEFTNLANFSLNLFFQNCLSLRTVQIKTAGPGRPISINNTFDGCASMIEAPFFDTSQVSTATTAFGNCVSLAIVPAYNFSSCSNFTSMFTGGRSLQSLPLLVIAAPAANMTSMFANCSALKTVPLLNTATVTNMSQMFQNCNLLETIPLFNTAAVTLMSQMFAGCSSLQSIPLLNTVVVASFSAMFQGCTALTTIPLLNTAAGTNLSSMFSGCSSLISIPLLNTAANTTFASMFANCLSLTSMPELATNAATTTFASMFSGCSSLRELPAINIGRGTTAATGYTTIFSGCRLSRIRCTGAKFTHTIASNLMSGAALDEYYTGLPVVTAQTLTVTGNFGTTTDTPSIATAKGWTVTGS